MPKEIWSNRYGRNPREGLHKWLESKMPDYKRSQLQQWLIAFGKHQGNLKDQPTYASANFKEFSEFVIKSKFRLPLKTQHN